SLGRFLVPLVVIARDRGGHNFGFSCLIRRLVGGKIRILVFYGGLLHIQSGRPMFPIAALARAICLWLWHSYSPRVRHSAKCSMTVSLLLRRWLLLIPANELIEKLFLVI